jgi:hypothetical protein
LFGRSDAQWLLALVEERSKILRRKIKTGKEKKNNMKRDLRIVSLQNLFFCQLFFSFIFLLISSLYRA